MNLEQILKNAQSINDFLGSILEDQNVLIDKITGERGLIKSENLINQNKSNGGLLNYILNNQEECFMKIQAMKSNNQTLSDIIHSPGHSGCDEQLNRLV